MLLFCSCNTEHQSAQMYVVCSNPQLHENLHYSNQFCHIASAPFGSANEFTDIIPLSANTGMRVLLCTLCIVLHISQHIKEITQITISLTQQNQLPDPAAYDGNMGATLFVILDVGAGTADGRVFVCPPQVLPGHHHTQEGNEPTQIGGRVRLGEIYIQGFT